MFTGIIENLGIVTCAEKTRTGLRLEIRFDKKVRGLKLGESIAVDGVCLTATQIRQSSFTADVVRETLKSTMLGALEQGCQVHLERALKLGARLGGHTITGHVDGCGTVSRVSVKGRSKVLWLRIPASVKNFCLPKGSIAVNGVSLTIQDVLEEGEIKIALVPHTLQETLLGKLKKNTRVNIEADAFLRKSLKPLVRETAAGLKRQFSFLSHQGF